MTSVPTRRGIAPGLQNAARFALFLVERPSLAGTGFVIAIALLGVAGVNFYTWLTQPPALGPGQYLPPVAPSGPVATAPVPGQPGAVQPTVPGSAGPPQPTVIIPASQLPRVRPPPPQRDVFAVPPNDYDEPRYPIRIRP